MKRSFFFIVVFILCLAFGSAQNNSACLSKHQLFKMQSTSLDDIRMFLRNESWSFNGAKSNQSFNYFDYPINYNIVSWEKYYSDGDIILYNSPGKPNIVIYQSNSICFNNIFKSFISKGKTSIDEDKLVTTFKEGNITVEFREYKNDYSSRQFSILLYNSVVLNKEIQTLKEQDEALKKAQAEVKKKYDNALAEADMAFSSNKFEIAKIKYLTALEIENNIFVKSKIDLCDKAICEKLISKGDSLYNANQYDNALSIFIESKECSNYHSMVQQKIKKTERKILDGKINTIQVKGEAYLEDQKYDMALEQYNSILLLDKSNFMASEKIKQIQEIKKILAIRSTTVFSYRKTNNADFSQFKNTLLNDVSLQINKNKDGFLNLNYLISFDTEGTNLSLVKNISTSLMDYSNYLTSISQNGILKPATEGGYFLASKENLKLDIKWSTAKVSYKVNSKGIYQSEYIDQSTNGTTIPIKSFINRDHFMYGKYIFKIKDKEVNGKSFSDINLVNFRTVGPNAALLSMLMPGMGALKVTYGQKGWGRFTCFLISSGLAIGSKLYSDAQYKSYLNATNQTDIDKLYKNANISHKVALISGAVSASIYLHDIIWVLSKGAKNKKSSKILRNKLKQGPVNVQNQKIKL